MRKTIIVKTAFEGVHNYPNAPEPVAYLRNMHRHMFHVEVEMDVFHDDREVEFIMMKHQIDDYIKSFANLNEDGVWMLGASSCEKIATCIGEFLQSVYCEVKKRSISVLVSEDGENGAKVYLD